MRLDDEKLLETFRRKKVCEWCGAKVRTGLDPHHLFSRGMGGAGRLDLACNLIALCRQCHDGHHLGAKPSRQELLGKIAQREGLPEDDILDEIHTQLRKPKP